jgi:hypothetical protein
LEGGAAAAAVAVAPSGAVSVAVVASILVVSLMGLSNCCGRDSDE